MNKKYKDIEKKILVSLKEIGELQDNWDGYGSSSISKFEIEKAIQLTNLFLENDIVDKLWVGPSIDKGIHFELRFDDRDINVVLENDKIQVVLLSKWYITDTTKKTCYYLC